MPSDLTNVSHFLMRTCDGVRDITHTHTQKEEISNEYNFVFFCFFFAPPLSRSPDEGSACTNASDTHTHAHTNPFIDADVWRVGGHQWNFVFECGSLLESSSIGLLYITYMMQTEGRKTSKKNRGMGVCCCCIVSSNRISLYGIVFLCIPTAALIQSFLHVCSSSLLLFFP
ncbi:Uncharacterized protein APZ42_031975 [Daphnia magna]|uniref:Uncharacterized protein n=1 Tax=Daphnia magna TaxID=35525 RepID=A0A164MF69_9CRUS|nr:Uncharacterized protein APZ42_031975 [Daphnia magna]